MGNTEDSNEKVTQTNTGGGTYIGNDVNAEGDVAGRDIITNKTTYNYYLNPSLSQALNATDTEKSQVLLSNGLYPDKSDIAVIVFFNIVIFVALTWFFVPKVSTGCVSSIWGGLSLAAVSLELFHLIWRFLGETLTALNVTAGSVEIQIGKLAALFERLHPRNLSDRILWLQMILPIAFFIVIWFSGSPIFSKPDVTPNIQGFLINYADNHLESILPSSVLKVNKGSKILVEAKVSPQAGVTCVWSTTKGVLLPAGQCATRYTSSVNAIRDTLSVSVQSPCKTYQTHEGLLIDIISQ